MRIAAVQIKPVKGDVAANVAAHKKWAVLAVSLDADAVFFPELSLTGYEPSLANDLATDKGDTRFDGFQQLSDENNLTIGAGMPLRSKVGVQIGLITFQPDKPRQAYSKQLLHDDELPYFVPGHDQTIITIKGERLAPAICYESLQASHAANAARLGATIYMASVAKTQSGVEKALKHFPAIAGQYQIPVLMANCVGPCDNFISAGNSAVWNSEGLLVGQLDTESEGLLFFDTDTGEVTEKYLVAISNL